MLIRGFAASAGWPGISENIRVISVGGAFWSILRIYYFQNEGDPSMYVGSADLMPRNIDRRVEALPGGGHSDAPGRSWRISLSAAGIRPRDICCSQMAAMCRWPPCWGG